MENDIDFNSYLSAKKIDADQFNKSEPDLYGKLSAIFDQMHPDSFTAQKLFLINPIRRKYHLKSNEESIPAKPKVKFKPKFK